MGTAPQKDRKSHDLADCVECERLRVERESWKHAHELANLNLNAVATSADRGHFMILKTLTDEAKLDLDLVDEQIAQHRGGYTCKRNENREILGFESWT
jgi:hypothetical protein